MTKYKKYFQKMMEENSELFESFKKVAHRYQLDQDRFQEEYNKVGEKVVEIIREYEARLCSNTERGMYNKFSGGLAEKFQNEVRAHFPLIDNVGLIVEKFSIKKINLK